MTPTKRFLPVFFSTLLVISQKCNQIKRKLQLSYCENIFILSKKTFIHLANSKPQFLTPRRELKPQLSKHTNKSHSSTSI